MIQHLRLPRVSYWFSSMLYHPLFYEIHSVSARISSLSLLSSYVVHRLNRNSGQANSPRLRKTKSREVKPSPCGRESPLLAILGRRHSQNQDNLLAVSNLDRSSGSKAKSIKFYKPNHWTASYCKILSKFQAEEAQVSISKTRWSQMIKEASNSSRSAMIIIQSRGSLFLP